MGNVSAGKEEIIAVCFKQDPCKAAQAHRVTDQELPAGDFSVCYPLLKVLLLIAAMQQ